MADVGSLDQLEEAECWRLLASQPVGRVAVIVGHYPVVFPVNFTVDGRNILFRTDAGTKLWALHRSNVTFEVDAIDPVHRAGWSVMVRGSAREVDLQHDTGIAVNARAAAKLVRSDPWAPGERQHVVRVIPDGISGRRIRPPE
jgi:nitroimidazol reductase NimA-like FMN-containing flavoprotein (pyridoxamine 5'-phosphate oxidase superfamily)